MCRTATPVDLLSVISLAPAQLPSGAEHVNSIGMKLMRVEAGEFGPQRGTARVAAVGPNPSPRRAGWGGGFREPRARAAR